MIQKKCFVFVTDNWMFDEMRDDSVEQTRKENYYWRKKRNVWSLKMLKTQSFFFTSPQCSKFKSLLRIMKLIIPSNNCLSSSNAECNTAIHEIHTNRSRAHKRIFSVSEFNIYWFHLNGNWFSSSHLPHSSGKTQKWGENRFSSNYTFYLIQYQHMCELLSC